MRFVGRRVSEGGFTLIETLAVLALLGLILGALTAGSTFGLLMLTAENRVSEDAASFDVVDTTLRRLIEDLDPGAGTDPAPFIGTSERLECISALPDGARKPDGRMRVSLFVDDAHRLILRWRPYLRAAALRAPPPPANVELLAHVRRLELSFWQSGGGWTTVWRSPDLPALVRIRLRFAPGDARRWPDIVAAPIADRP